jgi:hypothetical protein
MTKLMSYKYTINSSSQMFTISSFSTFSSFIFSDHISLKYYYIFSFYKVTNFTIKKSPHPLKEIFCKYQLPVT